MAKHIYAVFFTTLTGKKTQTLVEELAFEPTKIISINEIPKVTEALKRKYVDAKEVDITGMLYLRSHEGE